MSARDFRSLQLATFAFTTAGSLAACGAANTPESATPTAAEQTAPATAETAPPQTEPAPAPPAAQASAPPPAQQEADVPAPEPAPAAEAQAAPAKTQDAPTSVVITTMSKGRGVPAPTRDAYKQIRGLLEEQKNQSAVTNIDTQRIGLEGEMRMCAEFRDRAQAEYTLEQIRKLSADVELIHVAEGPCPTTQGDTP
ncbi:hypothetical protein [Luteimonas gilva]|uniref:hypothetical protein n=1 Tax=Luteimonas gilva TaxID=2572684 RepID=UPI0016784708|nr:hypothetical protein [Luteimonas gilva]